MFEEETVGEIMALGDIKAVCAHSGNSNNGKYRTNRNVWMRNLMADRSMSSITKRVT